MESVDKLVHMFMIGVKLNLATNSKIMVHVLMAISAILVTTSKSARNLQRISVRKEIIVNTGMFTKAAPITIWVFAFWASHARISTSFASFVGIT
jgi:hypothetical protein